MTVEITLDRESLPVTEITAVNLKAFDASKCGYINPALLTSHGTGEHPINLSPDMLTISWRTHFRGSKFRQSNLCPTASVYAPKNVVATSHLLATDKHASRHSVC